MKLCKKFFFHKINKNMQRKPGLKCYIHSRVWRHLRQIQNFIPSWELIKTSQNFVQAFLSVKSLKLCHKNSGEIFASIPL